MDHDRRRFFAATASLGVGAAAFLPGPQPSDATAAGQEKEKPEEEVGATEDLMREHGVLNRVLLIYEEGLRRIRSKDDVAPEMFQRPATLIRKFVEDYHEKLEENFIFPEFEKAKQQVDLVKVLRDQHQAGRKATDTILHLAAADSFRKEAARLDLAHACEAFIRMYRMHEAREDTVLFPALRKIVSSQRLKELGEQFEKEEDELFGEGGFEKTVEQVAAIEKQLGIYELATFTAR